MCKGIDGLLQKNKVSRLIEPGCITGLGTMDITAGDQIETVTATHVIIATSSKVSVLPGVELNGHTIGTSTEALCYDCVPPYLVVIGAGYIGLELGSVWARRGAKVTVIEYLDRILPGMDREIADAAQRTFTQQGLGFRLQHRAELAKMERGQAVVRCAAQEPIVADKVLVAVGRIPNTDQLGLESIGLQTDSGRIPINDHFATSVPGFYAIGDVIRGPRLAHKAEEEGIAVAEHLAEKAGHMNDDAIPAVGYTHPEVASVGRTEEQLIESKVAYRKGVFPSQANGRAIHR